jgi:hypothetical protein
MRFRFLVFPLAAAALLLAAGCSFEIDYDRYAVVYGVEDYTGTANDLNWAVDDVQDMKVLLTTQGYFVTDKTESAATKAELTSDFQQAAAQVGPEDLFLFFFAGHGGSGYLDGVEPPAADSNDEFVVLYDGAADFLLYDDELADMLADIPCLKKVVILGTCNSGGFIGNALEVDGIPPAYDGDADGWLASLGPAISIYANFDGQGFDIPPDLAMVIAAAGEQEVSWEGGLGENGVLAHFLLQTPQYGDRNRDGYVTVTEAYDYIRRGIEAYWNPLIDDAEWVHSPHVSGGPLDFLLFQVP